MHSRILYNHQFCQNSNIKKSILLRLQIINQSDYNSSIYRSNLSRLYRILIKYHRVVVIILLSIRSIKEVKAITGGDKWRKAEVNLMYKANQKKKRRTLIIHEVNVYKKDFGGSNRQTKMKNLMVVNLTYSIRFLSK